jgi:hypothetical protein
MEWDLDGTARQPESLPQPVEHEASIPMTTEALEAAIERAKVRFGPYLEKIKDLKSEAELLQVRDDQSSGLAVSLGIRAKRVSAELTTLQKAVVKQAKEFTDRMSAFVKTFTQPLDQIEALTKKKNQDYQAMVTVKARELQKKIEEETRKAQEAVNQEAAKAGVEPVHIPVAKAEEKPKVVRTEEGSMYFREEWKFEVLVPYPLRQTMADLEVRHGAGELTTVDCLKEIRTLAPYLIFDEKEIRKQVKGGVREIPAVRIYVESVPVYK